MIPPSQLLGRHEGRLGRLGTALMNVYKVQNMSAKGLQSLCLQEGEEAGAEISYLFNENVPFKEMLSLIVNQKQDKKPKAECWS